jgi:predicted protein tyrosine phosphatase
VGGRGSGRSGLGRGGRSSPAKVYVTREDLDAEIAAYRADASMPADADVCTDAEALAAMEEDQ